MGPPLRKTSNSLSPRAPETNSSPDLLMQDQGSPQVSLLTPRPVPGSAGSVRGFAGVAQLVEHLFCKQVVSGSIPLASSSERSALASSSSVRLVTVSEGCPSGQREQAVNLPANAYVGSNPTPSTKPNPACGGLQLGLVLGSSAPPRWSESSETPPQVSGPRPLNTRTRALGDSQAQFIGRGMLFARRGFNLALQFRGSSSIGRASAFQAECRGFEPLLPLKARVAASALEQLAANTLKPTRPASLVAGEASASTGAQRTPVREHRSGAEAQPPAKIAGRRFSRVNVTARNAHLAQMVEHVLGKDEVTSSILVVGSKTASTH